MRAVVEAAGRRPGPTRRIVEFRAREIAVLSPSACDEHLAVGQQRRRVTIACDGEAAGRRPGPAGRIVEFRARENVSVVYYRPRRAPCHWAATSPCEYSCGGEAAGGRPSAARRIVEFRARESRGSMSSACDEHLAVGQQCGRVKTAGGSRLPVAVQLPFAES